MRVVWRTRTTATLAELLVGATQHCPQANRRFQNFKQKPFSELAHDNFAARNKRLISATC